MQPQIDFSQVTIEQVVARILVFRQVTRLDQSLLQSVLTSQNSISSQQLSLLKPVFDGVQKEWLWVAD
ncbi:MAG: hypothetical protein N3E45_02335 [Oscillatoriaceae bacterium SKW80]|nr:hypothetical protein [Oscillatoriaceae bacterium SKYG93]MCX8119663.1 hypothetical protein [Oscillatoriaceae bacterium SKW80]MDW8455130.1 hypothetical protein [Oscillatoriaceae cyanobacterium SKYGB_i_bin93]HIK28096.1 hypothetical protein [Oscillatoriaceae cyanobacterium M7585_C2015_266]